MRVKLEHKHSPMRTILDVDIWYLIVSHLFKNQPYTPSFSPKDLTLTVDGVEIPYSLVGPENE
jgi:hypothetical protein